MLASRLLTSARRKRMSVPPVILLLLSGISVQFGGALAKHLFPLAGPGGVVVLRLVYSAIFLLVFMRPSLRGLTRRDLLFIVAYGCALGLMNFTFYQALARIPLGIAVTVEFAGPLAVAIFNSRRPMDLLWAIMAGGAIVLLAPWTGGTLDPFGLLLALVAGGFWALYILFGNRMSQIEGSGILALGLAVAAIVVMPIGIALNGPALLNPVVLIAGIGVALLASVIPYTLEFQAMRSLPPGVFGILMSLEPGLATMAGVVALNEHLTVRAIMALLLITLATIGSTHPRRSPSIQ